MLDIGAGELIALAVVALIVLGPEKLPRYAAEAARMLRQLRRMAQDARSEVTRELGPEFQDISLRDLNPRSVVRKHLLDPLDLDDEPTKPASRPGPGRPGPNGAAASRTPESTSTEKPRFDPDAT